MAFATSSTSATSAAMLPNSAAVLTLTSARNATRIHHAGISTTVAETETNAPIILSIIQLRKEFPSRSVFFALAPKSRSTDLPSKIRRKSNFKRFSNKTMIFLRLSSRLEDNQRSL
jgi:hypothetical protein